MISRSGLNAVRGSIGMGQGNIRNTNYRSNDMFNSPYNKGAQESPYNKPTYASGAGLDDGTGGMQQQTPWNQWNFGGVMGAGSNSPYTTPVGGGFQQQQTPTVNPGQPGQAAPPQVNAPNASVPAGPTMPQFIMGSPNNPAVNLNGRDNPRRFMQRPSLSPQQMRQLTRPGTAPVGGYKPPDGSIDLPPGPVGY